MPKILIVDDSPTILRVIDLAIKDTGWEAYHAKDGLSALKLTKELEPDLILLDVMLPVYNGYQVCKLLKTNPKFKSTPIIMLTAKSSVLDRIKGRLANADMYLTKPFSQVELIEACSKFLRRS
jgi:twitching motility two-component system response regulator PilG